MQTVAIAKRVGFVKTMVTNQILFTYIEMNCYQKKMITDLDNVFIVCKWQLKDDFPLSPFGRGCLA